MLIKSGLALASRKLLYLYHGRNDGKARVVIVIKVAVMIEGRVNQMEPVGDWRANKDRDEMFSFSLEAGRGDWVMVA